MYKLIKPFLFRMSAEKAHHFTAGTFNKIMAIPILKQLVSSVFSFNEQSLESKHFGLNFKNPVGLAAGFDKDGKYIKSFPALGFGFYEIGTVTPLGQEGNPQPRLFRLPKDESLINRMGFNNDGVDAMVQRLKATKKNPNVIIGGNIGKNKVTPNDEAVNDYLICFEKLFDLVDYFVVNVSSPNTPNLRALQDKGPLKNILQALQTENQLKSNPKPILLKIAPDLTNEQLDDVIEVIQETKSSGLIATNTTISREGLNTDRLEIEKIGNGGLSGRILRDRSTEVVKYIVDKSKGKIPVIAVGGINSAEAAIEKLEAGASLVQVYSALVYEGPMLIKNIKKGIYKNSKRKH